jgi:hypothetical protein
VWFFYHSDSAPNSTYTGQAAVASRAGQGSPRPELASECCAAQRSVQLNDQRRVLRYPLPSHLYHSSTIASEYQQIEERIEQAVEFQVEQSEPPRITHLASLFDVPYQRLGRRLRGVDSRSTRAPTNKKLNNDQEAALITWLKRCGALGVNARSRAISISANSILRRAHSEASPPPTISLSWTTRFLQRYPVWKKRK